MGPAHPSVCPSTCPMWAFNSEKSIKAKIGVNVPHGRSNLCAIFQFIRSKVRARVCTALVGWLNNMSAPVFYFICINESLFKARYQLFVRPVV